MDFPRVLADNLWLLGHPYFHVYLVAGSKSAALIDTGISATADLIIRQTADLGLTPDFLIVTHPHGDHINGLPALRAAFPKAGVIAGPGASEFLGYSKIGASLIHEDQFMGEFLKRQGFSPGRKPLEPPPSLEGSLCKGEGQELDLGDRLIRFLHVRGHSPGNLAIHIPDVETLLVSDSLGFPYPGRGYFPIFFTGYLDYIRTIERMDAFNPKMIGLAHLEVRTGGEVAWAFRVAREIAEEMTSRIEGDSRGDEPLATAILRDFYRDELTLYSPENILACCRLLVRRVRERFTP